MELTSEQVRLREFADCDWDAYASQADYPEMFEFMKFRFPTRAEARPHFDWLVHPDRFVEPRGLYFLVIEDPSDRMFAGYAGVGGAAGARQVEFGWYLLPPYWGRGLAPAATALILQWGFESGRYDELYATCDPENLRSSRALEKAGLHLDGQDTDVDTWRGRRARIRYSVTADQWRQGAP